MANEILIKSGTVIILADTTDHNPTAGVSLIGTRTDQLRLTTLLSGDYSQSDKFDFTTPRGARYLVRAAIEWAIAPAAGEVVNFFIGYSNLVAAANNNPGNASGVAGVYNGYGAAPADADEAIKQLRFIGSLIATADIDTQIAEIGVIEPKTQFGIIIVQNDTGQSFIGDAVEMSVHLEEIIDEVQDTV